MTSVTVPIGRRTLIWMVGSAAGLTPAANWVISFAIRTRFEAVVWLLTVLAAVLVAFAIERAKQSVGE